MPNYDKKNYGNLRRNNEDLISWHLIPLYIYYVYKGTANINVIINH